MKEGSTAGLQTFWDFRAAGNFIGGGTGTGLLVFAAIGTTAGAPYFLPGLAGLAFVGLGLTMVWFEIGKPWRAINVFFRPHTSWMSREAIAALFLFAIGAIALGSDWPGTRFPWALSSPITPALLTAAVGLGFLYCQLRMLHAVRGVPAWRERTVMPLVGLSGLVEGSGLYLIYAVSQGQVPLSMLVIVLLLIIARALAWRIYQQALGQGDVPRATDVIFSRLHSGFLILGHGLPAILIVLALFWQAVTSPLLLLAAASGSLSGWWFKIVLVTRAAHTRGTSLPILPVRGQSATPAGTS
jgi:phenylacetyl-CoA:acceptor oxidoreductase 26-kDa subunit